MSTPVRETSPCHPVSANRHHQHHRWCRVVVPTYEPLEAPWSWTSNYVPVFFPTSISTEGLRPPNLRRTTWSPRVASAIVHTESLGMRGTARSAHRLTRNVRVPPRFAEHRLCFSGLVGGNLGLRVTVATKKTKKLIWMDLSIAKAPRNLHCFIETSTILLTGC